MTGTDDPTLAEALVELADLRAALTLSRGRRQRPGNIVSARATGSAPDSRPA